MAFTKKPHYILILFMISSILVLFATSLDISNDAAEAPSSGSSGDNLLNQAKRHVVIHNVVANRKPLNVHCKSSEVDLGVIQLPWGHTWDFSFYINSPPTTKYRCHFTWYKGGDHYFDIFLVSRDDNPFGKTPACTECIWDVGRDKEYPMCRKNPGGSQSYCFKWDVNS